jgi:dGTPase
MPPILPHRAGGIPQQHEGSRGPRSAFQRDRDRIIHSIAFRRLAGKTQVFIAPDGDHFRVR